MPFPKVPLWKKAPFERLRALRWSGCKKCNANVLSIWLFMNCYTASLIHGMSSFSQKFQGWTCKDPTKVAETLHPIKIQELLHFLKLEATSKWIYCIPFIVDSWFHWRCLGWTHENMCPSNRRELNLLIAREISPVSPTEIGLQATKARNVEWI